MLNITDFLSRGETSLYSNKAGLMKRTAVAVVAPLVIGMLSACSVAPTSDLAGSYDAPAAASATRNEFTVTGARGSEIAATVSARSRGNAKGYSVDGNTLLMQALLDPSMGKIRVASSTSDVLDAYVSSLPSNVRLSMMGKQSPPQLASGLQNLAPDGVAISHHSRHQDSACIVFAVGASSTKLPNGKPAKYVDFTDALYVASTDLNDATTMLHELTHCLPNIDLKLDNHPLSPYYESSIREVRSDLAIVLYGASKTGSFESGLENVSTFRGATPIRPNHATVAMLEVITKGLNPRSFVGMPAQEVINSAVAIVNGLAPATNTDLRLAFAKEAWANKLSNRGISSGDTSAPSNLYTSFAGQSFQVDLQGQANTIINRSLDHALSQSDIVRASKKLTVERVEAFAKKLGVSLTKVQRAKAEFVDGTRTAVGTKVSHDGSIVATKNPFTMAALESSIQGDLKTMVASGLISIPNPADKALNNTLTTISKAGSLRGLNKTFGSALEALQSGLAKQDQHRELPASTLRGPGQ
ncbi:hypothetical protein [Pseudomonas sp. UMAB-40]|uniref:hypothetical protein n=1 Tax=Pseudomonas sp. UMAB-40 TaxID=1365407 RepID=UPI001C58C40D|nr:hypothetical protein [Pseudomonas sp. UMAB-40]